MYAHRYCRTYAFLNHYTTIYAMRSEMTFFSTFLLLLLLFDPLGNIPPCISLLSRVSPERRQRVLIRELLFALFALVLFLAAGHVFLDLLSISSDALSLAGGVILFIIALRMIFPHHSSLSMEAIEDEPYVVPLAIPLIAGPAAMSTILLLMHEDPGRRGVWFAAILLAWGITSLILLSAGYISRIMSERSLRAIERIIGMILTVIAIQMMLQGIRQFVRTL